MSCVKDKILLILGGVTPMCEIAKEAKKMGAIVYVTDYIENSPAKKLADKSFMVSATDVDAVVELCRREHVDGIITGYVDMLLPYAEEICRKLGLPFWGDSRNIAMCINKNLFKDACEKSGLPVVPWKKITKDTTVEELGMPFPIVIKPSDSSGSRGVFKCYSEKDYYTYLGESSKFSKTGVLLAERLMNPNQEFSAYYMIRDGKAYLSGVGDRFVGILDKNIAPVGQGMRMPSVKLDGWVKKVHPLMEKFFADNNMRQGYVFVQGFYEEGAYYIHEIGYRLNGGFTYKIIEQFSGYNQVQELIKFVLNGDMDASEVEKSNPYFDGVGFVYTLYLRPGTIASISGIEEAKKAKGVFDVITYHAVGHTVTSKGTSASKFANILCGGETIEALKETLHKVKNAVNVRNGENESMLYDSFDIDSIQT